MQSNAKLFDQLLYWFVVSGLLTRMDCRKALVPLDGVEGVRRDELYISAAEQLGWLAAEKNETDVLAKAFVSHRPFLESNSNWNYYLVQAIVDVSARDGKEIDSLIDCAPERYQFFLRRRFLPG